MTLFDLPNTLLADFDVWAVIPVIMLVLYGIAQVFNREEKAKRPRAQGQPARRAANVDPRDEVERFLREVASRRRGEEAQDVEMVRPARPRAERPREARPRSRQVARQSANPARPTPPKPEPPIDVEVVPNELGAGVREHVRSHLGTSEHFGEGVERAVHEHFDHQLGTMARTDVRKDIRQADIFTRDLLGSPDKLRQAIILSEILNDPVSLRPPQQ